MYIRKTTEQDIPAVMDVFDRARAFMRAHGNLTQWPVGSPSEGQVRADVAAGGSYVVVADEADAVAGTVSVGQVVGTFAFLPGPDETYAHIEDGSWSCDDPYFVMHRVASSGAMRGVGSAAFEWCQQKADYLRIDTHEDNVPMQNAIRKYGFERCGIIHIADGSPRVAFDWQRI